MSKFQKDIRKYFNVQLFFRFYIMMKGWNMNLLKIFLLILMLSGNIFALEQINDKNWKNHPEIVKIRNICNEIEILDKTGKLKFEWKECEQNGSLWIDSKGVIRKYRIIGGAGDTYGKTEYCYDENGILRFIYDEYGSVNGTAVGYRIYFEENGKHIYTKHTEQGLFGPSIEPPEEIKNPKEHYEKLCVN